MSFHNESFETASPVMTPVGRTLPHSLEAEEHLLSCCMLDGADIVGRCLLGRITSASFYDPKHGIIYERLVAMYAEGKPIDISTVAEELKTARQLDQVGGYAFLAQVSSRIPTTAQAGYFMQKVIEHSVLRQMVRAGTKIVDDCYNFSGEIDTFIGNAEQELLSATRDHLPEAVKSWSTAIDEADVRAKDIIAGKDDGFVTFGLSDLDKAFAKAKRGELVVLAARPSVGKSSLLRGMALRNARAGLNTYVNSLEVPAADIALQMASSESGISLRYLAHAHPKDQEDFVKALRSLRLKNLHVYDNDRSLGKICARLRALKPDVAFIDYLGLIEDCNPRAGETKAQAVGRVTKALKQLAIELNIVIVILSQLNRASVSEGNREPRLDDLRDSGDIEQDADRVIFLHLPATNLATGVAQSSTSDPMECPTFYVNAIQAKGRNVGTGICGILFQRAIARFLQLDRNAA
jgi:replicative DNA helicase